VGGDPGLQVVADHLCPGLFGGGLHMKAGVDGLCIPAKYIFAIFDSWSVVRAVLGVAGVKPFHSRACSYLCTAVDRRNFQQRYMNSAAVKRMMMPMTPATNPMPIAAFEERRDGFGEGEEDSCAVGVDSDVYCKEGVGVSVPSTCMAVVVVVTVVNSVNT
jgi:hypothetical protein